MLPWLVSGGAAPASAAVDAPHRHHTSLEPGAAKIKTYDVIVVGGGVIGCASALEAARRGRSTVVLDRRVPGRGASWAAAGMLAPAGEAEGPGPFLELARRSFRRFPDYVRAVHEASGVDPHHEAMPTLHVALDEDEAAALRARQAWQTDRGLASSWLAPDEARAREPLLGDVAGALRSEDALVDSRRLGRALRRAAEREGARVLAGIDVERIVRDRGRAVGVATRDGTTLTGELVILAAGAWSGRFELPWVPPVTPVRGQVIAVDAPEPTQLMVEGAGVYVVPRRQRGANALVGATMEDVAFDEGITEAARKRLFEGAQALFRSWDAARIADQWAGLRPATPDGLPLVGPDPVLSGLLHASGHFRNGILLTPVTADLVGELLDGETTPNAAVAPARFT